VSRRGCWTQQPGRTIMEAHQRLVEGRFGGEEPYMPELRSKKLLIHSGFVE
jgi:hypothetical protein